MNYFSGRIPLRLATVGLLSAVLGLAACGLKGPLDPPPNAITGEPQAGHSAPPNLIGAPIGGKRASQDVLQIGPNGQPLAPKGEKKHIPLDVLLD